MPENNRRKFLTTTVALAAGSTVFAASTHAGSQGNHGEGMGMKIDAAVEDTCATCQYWGGMRKVSKDKSVISTQSMGWCNNPESMSYQKLTNADRKMKKAGVWQKWAVL